MQAEVIFLLPALAVLLGGSIYLLFRPGPILFHQWISKLEWIPADFLQGAPLSHLAGSLPGWVIYSLPNGLWAFAYTFLILCIWTGNASRIRYVWMASIPLLVFGFESLQYLHLISGIFCIQDLLGGLLGILAGSILWKLIMNQPKSHKNEN